MLQHNSAQTSKQSNHTTSNDKLQWWPKLARVFPSIAGEDTLVEFVQATMEGNYLPW